MHESPTGRLDIAAPQGIDSLQRSPDEHHHHTAPDGVLSLKEAAVLGPVLDTVIGLVFLFTILSAITSGIVEWGARHFKVRPRFLLKAIAGLLGDKADDFWQDPLVVAAEKPGARKLPSRENARSFTVPDEVREILDRSREAPSYVAPRTFSRAVTGLFSNDGGSSPTSAGWSKELRRIVKREAKARKKTAGDAGRCDTTLASLAEKLIPLADAAGGDHEGFLLELETWFNDTMDRVTGWYKQSLKVWLLLAGFAVAVVSNADAVHVAQTLWNEETVRTAVADAATEFVNQPLTESPDPAQPTIDPTAPTTTPPVPTATPEEPTTEPAPTTKCDVVTADPTPSSPVDEEASVLEERINACIEKLRDLESLGIPLGWPLEDRDSSDPRVPKDFWSWILKVLGWLITAASLSLGAPFWFDLLGKVVNLRTTGAKPTKQPDEANQ